MGTPSVPRRPRISLRNRDPLPTNSNGVREGKRAEEGDAADDGEDGDEEDDEGAEDYGVTANETDRNAAAAAGKDVSPTAAASTEGGVTDMAGPLAVCGDPERCGITDVEGVTDGCTSLPWCSQWISPEGTEEGGREESNGDTVEADVEAEDEEDDEGT